jgi:hypothetical protein
MARLCGLAASGAALLVAMAGREDAAGHEWTPAAAAWTPATRNAFAARMGAAQTNGKFVRHCARQADSIERLVEHVGRAIRLSTNVDLQVVRRDGKLKIRKLHSKIKGRPSARGITASAEGYCTSRQMVRRFTEVRQPCEIIQTYKLR